MILSWCGGLCRGDITQCFSWHRFTYHFFFSRIWFLTTSTLLLVCRSLRKGFELFLTPIVFLIAATKDEGIISLRLTFVRSPTPFTRHLFLPLVRQFTRKNHFTIIYFLTISRILVFGLMRRDLRLARRGSARRGMGVGVGKRNKNKKCSGNEVEWGGRTYGRKSVRVTGSAGKQEKRKNRKQGIIHGLLREGDLERLSVTWLDGCAWLLVENAS